jgi:hypothetical protein
VLLPRHVIGMGAPHNDAKRERSAMWRHLLQRIITKRAQAGMLPRAHSIARMSKR